MSPSTQSLLCTLLLLCTSTLIPLSAATPFTPVKKDLPTDTYPRTFSPSATAHAAQHDRRTCNSRADHDMPQDSCDGAISAVCQMFGTSAPTVDSWVTATVNGCVAGFWLPSQLDPAVPAPITVDSCKGDLFKFIQSCLRPAQNLNGTTYPAGNAGHVNLVYQPGWGNPSGGEPSPTGQAIDPHWPSYYLKPEGTV